MALEPRNCDVCEGEFTPKVHNQRRCGKGCRGEARRERERMSVKGTSTLYDGEGRVIAQWVKEQAEHDVVDAALEAMCEKIPRVKAVKPPKRCAEDLLNLYVLTDYHLGMMAWGEETGADWDMKIAEKLLLDWFQEAIVMSPDAEVGVLANLGDLLHVDGLKAITPENHNLLDADTRFAKLVRVAIRVLRQVVEILLQKHQRVHIIHATGNHDEASSIWLREWFAALYGDEPRVTVDQSPDLYYGYEWGKTLLCFHHGHRKPAKNLDDVLVGKFREEYGRTEYAYGHTGHLHHQAAYESNLMKVEQHPTLAAPDAYASSHGWLQKRGASVVTYSRLHGEVGRVVITPEMVGTDA